MASPIQEILTNLNPVESTFHDTHYGVSTTKYGTVKPKQLSGDGPTGYTSPSYGLLKSYHRISSLTPLGARPVDDGPLQVVDR